MPNSYSAATPNTPKISRFKKAGILATSISVLIGIISVTGIIGRGGGADPCATFFAAEGATALVQNGGYQCAVNTGVPAGVSLSTAGTCPASCPSGVTGSVAAGYTVTSCVTISNWQFNAGVEIRAANGTHAIGQNEATTRNAACVKLIDVKILAADCLNKCASIAGLDTGFSGSACPGTGFTPCGPVFASDTEIRVGRIDGADAPQRCADCVSGVSYCADDTNLHFWRVYCHGGVQGIDADGYSEAHNSFLIGDRVNTRCNPNDLNLTGVGPGQDTCAHGDGYFQQNGASTPGVWLILDHTTVKCGYEPTLDVGLSNFGEGTFCSTDGGFFSHYPSTGVPVSATVINNLYLPSDGNFCQTTGQQSGAPYANNVFTGNMFVRGPGLHGCGTASSTAFVSDFNNDNGSTKWCNNRLDDGQLVGTNVTTKGVTTYTPYPETLCP